MPQRRAAAASRDSLSALPDDLLHRILRPLDARQAVRDLSLLSRRWRRVWASSPFVTVTDKGSAGSERFVNNLLLLRDPVDLQVLCLHSWQSEHFAFQRRWLCHALSRGLRVLELALQGDYTVGAGGLPDRIFTCATLEEINLSSRGRDVIAPKSAVCLPRLKKMHLEYFRIDPSAVEKLNSGSPSLEDFDLFGCRLGSFKISSETLKTLSIIGCRYDEIHVSAPNTGSLKIDLFGRVYPSAMPSLVSAWVNCVVEAEYLAPCAYDLIAALCNAQRLELYRFDVLLQDIIVQKAATEGLLFSNLKSLHVGEWRVTDFYNTLDFFIRRAPNLAALALDQWKNMYQGPINDNGFLPMPSKETKPSAHGNLKLLPSLPRNLETLWIRVSKREDAEEFRKMRSALKEKTKPRETEVVWLETQSTTWRFSLHTHA